VSTATTEEAVQSHREDSGMPLHLFHWVAGEATIIEDACPIAGTAAPGPFDFQLLAVSHGSQTHALEVIEVPVGQTTVPDETRAIGDADLAVAVLNNGLGRYRAALAAALQACEHEDFFVAAWALVELVEAATRSGAHEIASVALERLVERTPSCATNWAFGMEALSRALLSDDSSAESHYSEAVDRLARSSVVINLARAHLLFGEWLRRQRRRIDAREQLRTARDMFVTMGANGFAERAERELLATGATARKRTVETRDQLTAQETQVARLARDGHSSREIGALLFISPRTVQYHLQHVFTKIGISSRMQLERALPL
jgi:DNA-binding CsgD family transcriptional regulator